MANNRTGETRLENVAGTFAGALFWATTVSPFICSGLDRLDLAVPVLIGGYALTAMGAIVEAGETKKRIAYNRP